MLKMDEAWTSKMLVCYNTIWHHNPEDLNLNHHHPKHLKSQIPKLSNLNVLLSASDIRNREQKFTLIGDFFIINKKVFIL